MSTAASTTHPDLVVVALNHPTVQQAAALEAALPSTTPLLWVRTSRPTVPAAGAAEDQQYQKLLEHAHNLRIMTLPVPLTAPGLVATDGSWTAAGAEVIAGDLTNYLALAYQIIGPGEPAASLLSYAEAQLGKPYLWAGSGPDSFDCSGLTMMAYRQVGIAFVHNAYAQYEATKQWAIPSKAALQPGDLVFFGPNEAGIHHVGIYVGGGQFLDAPNTGSLVRFDTLGPGWDYFGATRPLESIVTMDSTGSIQVAARQTVDRIWGDSQWPYLDLLWTHESDWNPAAVNPTSGATGIPQALPPEKMAATGPDWRTNPVTQVTWGLQYIQARYGNPQTAWAHELIFDWY